jgi:hypothetical protein
MLPGMPLGPVVSYTPPSASGHQPPGEQWVPPSEATAEWRTLDSLTSPVGKQWVLSPRPQPLGSWARLRQSVVYPHDKLMPEGTVVRVVSEKGPQVKVWFDGQELAMKRDWLDPAEPPRTALERLLGPDVPWGG